LTHKCGIILTKEEEAIKMFVFPILLIVLVYFLFNNNQINYRTLQERNPEDILKKRYVNGEIDEDTYLKMSKVIKE
jgi:putative membrane protein